VEQWQPGQINSSSTIVLVAQSASMAWFELSIRGIGDAQSVSVGAPLALEIELGNGSWETSMIARKSDLAPGAVDTFRLDLLFVIDSL
jgi:hypothetical protein